MKYCDIHTHRIPDKRIENTSFILNVFPEEFQLSKQFDTNIFYSCGVHPWHSVKSDDALKILEDIAADDRIVAIGEAGLDKYKGADAPIQEIVFRRQIELSELVGKPMVIHNVKSWDRLIEMYEESKPTQSWILHGYRGKPELTKRLSSLGFYFSIGEYFNPESINLIPKEKMFCETDESELGIEEVYKRVSDALQMDLKDFATIVVENVKRLFPVLDW